jgi:hypothetical protein
MVQSPEASEEDQVYLWSSRDGKYTAQASLVDGRYDSEKRTSLLILRKKDGSVVEVPANRLSEESRRLAVRLLQQRRSAAQAGQSGPAPDPLKGERSSGGSEGSASSNHSSARRRESADGVRPIYAAPDRVSVLPVFLVPTGEPRPTPAQTAKLMAHMNWSQRRFAQLLNERDTFEFAEAKPHVYIAGHPLAFYRPLPESAAPQWTSELLHHYGFNRFNCPFVFVIVVMNSRDGFPVGGGRPLNGGFNTGGGIVILSSHTLDNAPNFQSTLQHELAHSFGLPHVDVYGYEMKSSPSIMSYNRAHHTNGMQPSADPGGMIPEDLRGLALNTRVFPKLTFDPSKHVPRGYSMRDNIVALGPMKIPGQFDYDIAASTDSGETYGSSVANVVIRGIKPSVGPGVNYDQRTMWHSDTAHGGWVSVDLTFPFSVRLTKIGVHSQHSGEAHAARAVRVHAMIDGTLKRLIEQDLQKVDSYVSFPETEAKTWKLSFRPGESGKVVIRGLRFFSAEHELFPPLVLHPAVPPFPPFREPQRSPGRHK